MERSIWEEHQKKKTTRFGMWILLGVALFLSVVCTPVYHWSASDILIADTAFPMIWDIVQYILQFVFYWVAFAFALHLSSAYTWKGCTIFLIAYAACVAVRYTFSLLAGYIMTAGRSGWDSFEDDLLFMLVDIAGDLIQMVLVILLFIVLVERKRSINAKKDLLESNLFAFSDPMKLCILLSAAIPSVLRLLSRIVYDDFFGPAQSRSDLIWIVISYGMDIISLLAGYLIIYLIILRLQLREEEAEADENTDVQGSDL